MIPFHVSVIKNVSKHDEGNTSSIRFNFHVPGSNLANANIIFPSLNKAPIYIKELTFRS
jgi:nucleosome binding factor SPN SPT16 subunit